MLPDQRLAVLALGLSSAIAVGIGTGVPAETSGKHLIEDSPIDRSMTNEPGNPEKGKQLVRDTSRATCLICHSLPIADEPDPGNIGPPLAGVADRYSEGELRLRLVNPKALNPETIMPSYFQSTGFSRVAEEYRDQSIYSAQEIEDVISYLLTLSDREHVAE